MKTYLITNLIVEVLSIIAVLLLLAKNDFPVMTTMSPKGAVFRLLVMSALCAWTVSLLVGAVA